MIQSAKGYGMLEFAGVISFLGILFLGGVGLTTYIQQGIRVGMLLNYLNDNGEIRGFKLSVGGSLVVNTQELQAYLNESIDRIEADLVAFDESGEVVDPDRYKIDLRYRIIDINSQTGEVGTVLSEFGVSRGSFSNSTLENNVGLGDELDRFTNVGGGTYPFAVPTGDYLSDPLVINANYLPMAVIVGGRILYEVEGGLASWVAGFLNRDTTVAKMKVYPLRSQVE